MTQYINSITIQHNLLEATLHSPTNLHKDGTKLKWDHSGTVVPTGYNVYKNSINDFATASLISTVSIKEYTLVIPIFGYYWVTAYTNT